MTTERPYKHPISVLVVLHDGNGRFLLLERADRAGFWQSVTGSVEHDEDLETAARREVWEETGIALAPDQLHNWQHHIVYEIYAHWRHRYPPDVTHNTEHWFSAVIPSDSIIRLAEKEHTHYQWLPEREAADLVFSPSNRDAILMLRSRGI